MLKFPNDSDLTQDFVDADGRRSLMQTDISRDGYLLIEQMCYKYHDSNVLVFDLTNPEHLDMLKEHIKHINWIIGLVEEQCDDKEKAQISRCHETG